MTSNERSASTPARPLFVLCAYHGTDHDGPLPTGRLAVRFGLPQIIAHRRMHRDFYANPRNLRYQLALAADTIAPGSSPRFILDRRLASGAEIEDVTAGAHEAADLEVDPLPASITEAATAADRIYLVYADALGLGCEPIEDALHRHAKGRCWIINGRRRVFLLTAPMRVRLALSRLLARTRLGEYAAAVGIMTLGYILAVYDRIRGRR